MAYDREKVIVCRCPECFARETDMSLRYDEETEEYYCVKCCFVGKKDEIEDFYQAYKDLRYRAMLVPHPFNPRSSD